MPVTSKLIPATLRPIFDKVLAGERVTEADGETLYRSNDLNALGAMANAVRERKNGNVATYIHNQYINYSNVCVLSCQFCAFGARKRDAHAFELAVDEIVEKVRMALALGITEIHMVGGLHPTLKGEWYLDLLTRLRALDEKLFIKAFTAIEIRHLAERIFKTPIRQTLELLRSVGLGAITGGGAEIFNPEVRERICRGKESAEEWAEVHRTWHEMGMPSTATMLFGHIETYAHRVDHLRRLRELQEETRGFTGFVPFSFEAEHARPELQHIRHATAFEELKNLAVSRIYLDNFDHLTAYWVSLGLPLASLALNYGVDDLHGTIMEERIFHMAGAKTPTYQTMRSLEKAIREAGREPMQRDTQYRRIASTWREPQEIGVDLACA
jgi:aminodeoxyfutalosine synthase